MTKQINNQESAMGRPASWGAALPAVGVGGIALLLAVYGHWVLPKQLEDRYASQMVVSQSKYELLMQDNAAARVGELVETAGELDVVYARLIGLRGGDPQLYWQWALFTDGHADKLKARIEDPAGSMQGGTRKRLAEQMLRFDEKTRKTIHELAAGDSSVSGQAQLWIANEEYLKSVALFVASDATKTIDALRQLVDTESQLDAVEMNAARLVLVRLAVENAWWKEETGRLVLDAKRLEVAQELFTKNRPSKHALNLEWLTIESLLDAFGGVQNVARVLDAKATASMDEPSPNARTRVAWETRLANVQLACVKGDWKEAAFLLEWNDTDNNLAVRTGFARTVCRLACSPLAADDVWTSRFDVGFQLAWQAAPNLPELAEVTWLCATDKLELPSGENGRILHQSIPPAVVAGQSGLLKHSVSAISNAIKGNPDVARVHLELMRRSSASLMIVTRTVLWVVQSAEGTVEPERLERLLGLVEMTTQLEPESGLNWFVLGASHLRAGNADVAVNALERALEVLKEVPAVVELLAAAKKQVRKETPHPQPLSPKRGEGS